jgi:hypothetical protein
MLYQKINSQKSMYSKKMLNKSHSSLSSSRNSFTSGDKHEKSIEKHKFRVRSQSAKFIRPQNNVLALIKDDNLNKSNVNLQYKNIK